MLNQKQLYEIIEYNKNTGIFTWKKTLNGMAKAGQVAGCVDGKGYIKIGINKRCYLAHRLAWFYCYGQFPFKQIDHINGIRTDNRICNIRECDYSDNQQNRTSNKNSSSKYIGVSWHKKSKKWQANIRVNKKLKNLGFYDCEEFAYQAYLNAKKIFHKFNPVPRRI